MQVTTRRDGEEYLITFKNGGHLDQPLKKIGSTNKTGTTVKFLVILNLVFLQFVKECKSVLFWLMV